MPGRKKACGLERIGAPERSRGKFFLEAFCPLGESSYRKHTVDCRLYVFMMRCVFMLDLAHVGR